MAFAKWASPTSEPSFQDPRRELIERVLASSGFAKSRRLSGMFRYLCELTLEGRASEINEQSVGEAVFGRQPDYDSMADGIVRTQASRLRQRLDHYFSEEGAGEPVTISIPRGSYVPVFEQRAIAESDASEASSAPASDAGGTVSGRMNFRQHSAAVAWTCTALLALALAVLLIRRDTVHAKAQTSVEDHLLWSRIFEPGQNTLLIPGDSSLVIWQGLKGRNISLDEYVSGSYRVVNPADAGQDRITEDLGGRRYTSIVDLDVAQSLALIAKSHGSGITVRYPREVRPNDLKDGNVILVGAAEADPWVTLFERDMDFVFFNNRSRRIFQVLNRSPHGNEPHEWDFVDTDKLERVYAVVAYLPNLSGNGNALILEGTTMAGTECAWDFVSDDSKLLPFLRSIRKPDGSLPHFEVVLGTNNVGGSAVESTILASRIR